MPGHQAEGGFGVQDQAGRVLAAPLVLSGQLGAARAVAVLDMDSSCRHLGEAYHKVIRVDATQTDRSIEKLMNRAWARRGTPLR